MYTTLREVTGVKEITVEAKTVREAINKLLEKYGGELRKALLDEKGNIKRIYTLLLDGRNIILLQGLDTPVKDGSTLHIFPPVGGG